MLPVGEQPYVREIQATWLLVLSLPGGVTSGWGMGAIAKTQLSQFQLEPCLTLESSGHHAMALEGFSLIFIVCWQQISLPAHPLLLSPLSFSFH